MTIQSKQKQFRSIANQQGWTFWSLMFVLGVLFVAAYITMQLIPIYGANNNLKNSMKVSVEDKDLRQITRSQIIKGMQAQLYLDGSSSIIDFKKDLKVTRNKKELVIQANYSRDVPLVMNLRLVADFNPALKCPLAGGQCLF